MFFLDNYQWLFSGIGVIVICKCLSCRFSRAKEKKVRKDEVNITQSRILTKGKFVGRDDNSTNTK